MPFQDARCAPVSPANDEAFEAFVDAHGAALLRLADTLTGDRGSSEEAVQSALERVSVQWHRLNDPLHYARQIVVNLCRDQGRGDSHREWLGLPWPRWPGRRGRRPGRNPQRWPLVIPT
jgi:DNA-directed RNA polymerase specialized sigma24 family protein